MTFSLSSLKTCFASARRDVVVGIAGEQLGQDFVDAVVVFELVLDLHRVAERPETPCPRLRERTRRRASFCDDLALRLAGFLGEPFDAVDDLLDRRVRVLERLNDLFLGDLFGARLDHHDGVVAAGDQEIETALAPLLVGGIDQVLTLDEPHAHAGDRPRERDVGEGQRGGGAGDREHVAVVLGVGGEHEGDDLRLVAPARGKQRANRPVDEPAGQHFLLGRLAFTLEEAAGDAPRSVGVLAVVNRQRQEVDAFPCGGRGAGGYQDHRVARSDDHGAVGLLGKSAGFDRHGVSTHGNVAGMHVVSL